MAEHIWKTSQVPGMYYCYNCDAIGFWNREPQLIEVYPTHANDCKQDNPHRVMKVETW